MKFSTGLGVGEGEGEGAGFGPPETDIVISWVTGAVISWNCKLTVSVTVPGLLGVESSSDTIVVPGGISPIVITLPTTSCVEACIAKSAKSVLAWMVAPWAVAEVGFITVKLTVQSVLNVTEEGYDMVKLR